MDVFAQGSVTNFIKAFHIKGVGQWQFIEFQSKRFNLREKPGTDPSLLFGEWDQSQTTREYQSQFSSINPGTRENSFTLLVTSISPDARACPAIIMS
jgi:hypothetical protein